MDRLRYFVTIQRTGSLSAAARILHVSPAALSKAMRVLEGELGTRLFVPAGRGIAVTDQGRDIARRAEVLLEQLRSLRPDREAPSAAHPHLRLASFEVFTTYFLGELVEKYLGDSQVQVHELVPGKMEEAVVSHEADLGITYLPVPHPELDFLPVTKVEMQVCGTSRFANLPLSELPFAIPIVPVTGSPNKVKGLDGWPDQELPRKVLYRVTLMETALELCRRGLSVSYLPSFIVRLHNAQVKPRYALSPVQGIKLGPLRFQAVYLIKRKSDAESALVRRVAKALRVICHGTETLH